MADPYVPPAVGGDRPWWAKPFASIGVREKIGYLSAILLGLSIVVGAWTLPNPNFELVASKQSSPSTCKAPAASECEKSLTPIGKWKIVTLLFWILVPPCWFWFEYFFLYRYDPQTIPGGTHKPDWHKADWDNFKYGQEVSSKVWLALVTALTILYFGKDIRG